MDVSNLSSNKGLFLVGINIDTSLDIIFKFLVVGKNQVPYPTLSKIPPFQINLS